MTQLLKIIVIYILRAVLKLFYVFPVNSKRIIFVCNLGKQYACNPKYLFEYIHKNYGGKYSYVWSLKERNAVPKEYNDVKICGYLTLKYIYFVMTSKYIINNQAVEPVFPFRKNQAVVYTWHGGGAYKKVNDVDAYKKRKWSMLIMRNIRSKMVTHVISSCKKFTEIYGAIWNLPENIFLRTGMPRNDIFFTSGVAVKEKVYNHYGITPDKKIVLYAPTFRGDFHAPVDFDIMYTLNSAGLLSALKAKYGGDFMLMYRSHATVYHDNDYFINAGNGVVPVSDYPDMQELLYAADVLITDYSSSVWDFSFTFKPCFIYAPDLNKYRTITGFYTPIEEWPFPLAETNEELFNNIYQFNEDVYRKKVEQHHAALVSYETGTACEQLCRYLF